VFRGFANTGDARKVAARAIVIARIFMSNLLSKKGIFLLYVD
jgi:hypothetical protein